MSGATRVQAILLIAAMAVGSIVLWLGVPVAWIWGASAVSGSQQPSIGIYGMLILGIPVTMVLVGRFLGKLNRVYGEVTDTTPTVRVTMPWQRSMRGDRDERHPRTVLDVVMVVSVSVALAALGIWFFFFAKGGGI